MALRQRHPGKQLINRVINRFIKSSISKFIQVDGKVYHPACYKDFEAQGKADQVLQEVEMEDEEKPKAEEESEVAVVKTVSAEDKFKARNFTEVDLEEENGGRGWYQPKW